MSEGYYLSIQLQKTASNKARLWPDNTIQMIIFKKGTAAATSIGKMKIRNTLFSRKEIVTETK